MFCIFDENDRKYPGDDTVVAQKNEVKAEEARLSCNEMDHSDGFSLQSINQSSDLLMTIDGTK